MERQVRTGLGRSDRWYQHPCGQARIDGGHGVRCDHHRGGSSRREERGLAGSGRWQQASGSGGVLYGRGRCVHGGGLVVLVYDSDAIQEGAVLTRLWRTTSLSVLVGRAVLVAVASGDTRQRRSVGCAARVVAVCVHGEESNCSLLCLKRGYLQRRLSSMGQGGRALALKALGGGVGMPRRSLATSCFLLLPELLGAYSL